MKRFNYPEELLQLIEEIVGKDSDIYRLCEQGMDIGLLVSEWGVEYKFSNEEILAAKNEHDFKLLQLKANINMKKNEAYELYLHSYSQEVFQGSLIGKMAQGGVEEQAGKDEEVSGEVDPFTRKYDD